MGPLVSAHGSRTVTSDTRAASSFATMPETSAMPPRPSLSSAQTTTAPNLLACALASMRASSGGWRVAPLTVSL